MKIFAETKRLILREILPSDLEDMFELDSDPMVHQYLGNKTIVDKNKIAEIINHVRQQYTDHRIGRWAIIEKDTNRFIGWSGLKFVTELTNGHQFYYDLGYRLKRKYWGHGFATESASASLDYAFNVLKTDDVYAAANCENTASINVLQKVGMKFSGTFYYEDILCNWYKIEKSDYQAIAKINK